MKKILLFFYFLSGAAGLIYETIWIRRFSSIMGGTSYALGMVLSAFMLGLAAGSFIFGRLSYKRPLRLYGILEIGIGLSGFLLPFLFTGVDSLMGMIVPVFLPDSVALLAIKFFLGFVILLIPCSLMGGTFPVLGQYIADNRENFGHSVGVLYGLNLLGAFGGCLLSGFMLIERLGLYNTNLVAVFINIMTGLVVLSVWKKTGVGGVAAHKMKYHYPPATYWALGAVFLSGLFALSLEVVTHRVLFLILRNTTYAYTLMLSVTLLGLFAGNIVISKWADRIKNPWMAITGALVAAALYTTATIPLYGRMNDVFYDLVVSSNFFGGSWLPFLLTQAMVCGAVLFVPMFLSGLECENLSPTASNKRGTPALVRFTTCASPIICRCSSIHAPQRCWGSGWGPGSVSQPPGASTFNRLNVWNSLPPSSKL